MTCTMCVAVRCGAVEIYRPNGERYNRLVEGDIFGQASLLRSNKVSFPARALEDSLIYYIPADAFAHLCAQHDVFADFVEAEGHSSLKTAVEAHGRASELISSNAEALSPGPWCGSRRMPASATGENHDRRIVAAGRNADETSLRRCASILAVLALSGAVGLATSRRASRAMPRASLRPMSG